MASRNFKGAQNKQVRTSHCCWIVNIHKNRIREQLSKLTSLVTKANKIKVLSYNNTTNTISGNRKENEQECRLCSQVNLRT